MLLILDTEDGKPREGLGRVDPVGVASSTTTLSSCRQWYSITLAEKVDPVPKDRGFQRGERAGGDSEKNDRVAGAPG
jgi:hypothetical protein